MAEYIDRQAVMTELEKEVELADDWNTAHEIANVVKYFPVADVQEVRWIPVSVRLPEEDKEVLISYRYKEGEGDTSHTKIDITTYGQMYFGGNKVGDYKYWRPPFEYFCQNYEVVAWCELPEPYKEVTE